MKKMLNEGNQIHNFISSSGSGSAKSYGTYYLRFRFHNTDFASVLLLGGAQNTSTAFLILNFKINRFSLGCRLTLTGKLTQCWRMPVRRWSPPHVIPRFTHLAQLQSLLRIRIRYPVPFFIPDPGSQTHFYS
jgi:hypothetical protein